MIKGILKIATLTCFILLMGCNSQQSKINERSITVSILPQKYFAQQMLGDKYAINVVLGKGANHENYEPTPRQMVEMEQSVAYLLLCHDGFDQVWADRLKDRNPSLKIYDLSKGVELLTGACTHDHEHEGHGIDPHIWISPTTVKTMVANMKEALVAQFPADSNMIIKGFENLDSRIDSMHQVYVDSLAAFKGKTFVVYHPATSYLARDYGLSELSIENEGKEPSVSVLENLIREGKSRNVNLILMQKEFDLRNATVVSNEIGADLVHFDPMTENWFDFSSTLLKQLTTHLNRP